MFLLPHFDIRPLVLTSHLSLSFRICSFSVFFVFLRPRDIWIFSTHLKLWVSPFFHHSLPNFGWPPSFYVSIPPLALGLLSSPLILLYMCSFSVFLSLSDPETYGYSLYLQLAGGFVDVLVIICVVVCVWAARSELMKKSACKYNSFSSTWIVLWHFLLDTHST